MFVFCMFGLMFIILYWMILLGLLDLFIIVMILGVICFFKIWLFCFIFKINLLLVCVIMFLIFLKFVIFWWLIERILFFFNSLVFNVLFFKLLMIGSKIFFLFNVRKKYIKIVKRKLKNVFLNSIYSFWKGFFCV